MSYYVYQNTNYAQLPNRIRLENKETRTSLHELDETELVALGIVIVEGDYPQPTQPEIRRLYTQKEFIDRFTDAELAGIMVAGDANAMVKVWIKRLELAGGVYLDDPQTIAGVNAIEEYGLIAAGRAAEILG